MITHFVQGTQPDALRDLSPGQSCWASEQPEGHLLRHEQLLTFVKVAKRPVPAAISKARTPRPLEGRPIMYLCRGTSVWRCMASWRPRNNVSVDTSYTLALCSDSHPSVCTQHMKGL